MQNQIQNLEPTMDQGLRDYLLGVYNRMGLGLIVTGLIAYLVGPEFMTSLGFGMQFLIILAPIAFTMVLCFAQSKLSPFMANLVFLGVAAAFGLSLSAIFAVYTTVSIVKVIFISSSVFAASSIYGYVTNKDLSSIYMFLFVGLIGLIVAGLVNLFFASGLMSFIISVAGVIIFTGFTAYDVQRLKNEYISGEISAVSSIYGALSMYLNFLNLFISLLSLFGDKK